MSARRLSLAPLLVAICPQLAHAAETKLAVMPLTAKRVPEATVDILDDLLVNEVGARSGSTVIGSQDINAILGLDKMKDALGCSDLSCAVQIGGALGVDFLLTGSVSTLGGEVIVSLTLIDTKESVAKKRAQVRTTDEERFYAYAIAAAVAQLYDLPAPTAPAAAGAPSDQEVLAAAAREHRRARSRQLEPPAAGAPTHVGTGGIRFKAGVDGVKVSVHSLTDGQDRTCAEPLNTGEQCYLQDLPAGPATVAFLLPDEKKVTREIVVRGGDLERQVQMVDGRLGAMPYIIGAVFVVGGAALLYAGLKMDDTIGTDGEPRWGETKFLTVALGGSSIASGLITPFIIIATAEDYPIRDSATPPPMTVSAPGSPPAFGLNLAPTPGGAAALATWRF